MKGSLFLVICYLLFTAGWVPAQSVPPPPRPIIETDLRDNTTKIRAIELERIKREGAKKKPAEITSEEIRFAKTKSNFEEIQILQDSIIKAYTIGREIDYSKISEGASEIAKRCVWLNENLFGAEPEEGTEPEESRSVGKKSVRDLIIELDGAIGAFVSSPIFQDTTVVDPKNSKKTQLDLLSVLRLSKMLSIEAGRLK